MITKTNLLAWLLTIYRLGLLSVLRNIWFRLKLHSGILKRLTPIKKIIEGGLIDYDQEDIIFKKVPKSSSKLLLLDADLLCVGRFTPFFNKNMFVGLPPKWFQFDEIGSRVHWSRTNINNVVSQDVKVTWELSRFHWAQILACSYSISGQRRYLGCLNEWFANWNTSNPVNCGVNWVCGQECSIRVIHVLNSVHMLHGVSLNYCALIPFVLEHAKRIAPTIGYAISQDNNHATSEGAALFICGSWLLNEPMVSPGDKKLALHWSNTGRKILEERVLKLVLDDGGFCMYSTNYHRVLLNTLSIVEFWNSKLEQKPFSDSYLEKCRAATRWLYNLVDQKTGDTLNLGANDGSNPFIIQTADYRDYRPSVQLASVLFLKQKLYANDASVNEPLDWLSVDHTCAPIALSVSKSILFPDFGLVKITSDDLRSNGFVKFPNYQFRPSQADMLHFDLWYEGRNILRDAGSYSYNSLPEFSYYFSSIKAHNTIEIDNAEPMSRLGVFLFGDWPRIKYTRGLERRAGRIGWVGSYSTRSGAMHHRDVSSHAEGWDIIDTVVGAKCFIVLRWRLNPDSWVVTGNSLSCRSIQLEIKSDSDMSLRLAQGFESKYYNEKEESLVLEVVIRNTAAIIETQIRFREEQ